jgi:hypothetical protein
MARVPSSAVFDLPGRRPDNLSTALQEVTDPTVAIREIPNVHGRKHVHYFKNNSVYFHCDFHRPKRPGERVSMK